MKLNSLNDLLCDFYKGNKNKNTDIATTKTFQERMFEKIRDQMGDLMTDEDLKKLVDAAMQKHSLRIV